MDNIVFSPPLPPHHPVGCVKSSSSPLLYLSTSACLGLYLILLHLFYSVIVDVVVVYMSAGKCLTIIERALELQCIATRSSPPTPPLQSLLLIIIMMRMMTAVHTTREMHTDYYNVDVQYCILNKPTAKCVYVGHTSIYDAQNAPKKERKNEGPTTTITLNK